MKRYHKIYKIIALWNSYHSLENSDYTDHRYIQISMDWCLDEIRRLGVDPGELPIVMDDLIKYLDERI